MGKHPLHTPLGYHKAASAARSLGDFNRMLRIRTYVAPFILLVIAFLLAPAAVRAQEEPPPAPELPAEGMISIEDRFAAPVLPENPTQADLGAQVYYMVCMACHGDQGQGLTPEWIASWELGEMTCWTSKCHASNHPPEGFKLPKFIPAVVSPAVPGRFETALALHDFIQAEMPWQAPGIQTEAEYWQLTAYLLRENGIDPGNQPLDRERAAALRLRPELPSGTASPSAAPQGSENLGFALVMSFLGGLALVALVGRKGTS